MKIAITGAGIAGLTTAIALQKKGFEVTVFEKTKHLEKVGAGIILAINAMKILRELDLENQLKERGYILNGMLITKPNLKPLTKNVMPYFIEKYGIHSLAIHRGDLQEILVNALLPGTLVTGKETSHVKESDDKILIDFTDGTSIIADLLIGADGIHSVARKKIAQNTTLRYVGQTCWRGVVNIPSSFKHDWSCLNEAWGQGKRFGFTRINENQAYWYALINSPSGGKDDKSVLTNSLLETFKDYSETVSQIIKATPVNSIMRNDIYDIPVLKEWHKGRTLILGDAAHAITPNLGQGACQAIEDAYCIAQLIEEGISKGEAFSTIFNKFYKARVSRIKFISDTSLNLGRLAQLENPVLIKLRNLFMKSIPDAMNKKQFEQVLGLDS